MASAQLQRKAHAELENKNQPSLKRHHHESRNRTIALNSEKDITSKINGSASNHHNDASDEEQSNDEEEEDSNMDEDVEDDEDDEPEVIAPSRGIGLIKRKREAGRTPGVVSNDDHDNDGNDSDDALEPELHDHGAGLKNGNLLAVPVNPAKKRRFSNLSASSILDTSNDDKEPAQNFPRKKKLRTLSNDGNGLLTYHAIRNSASDIPEVAVESSDDDDDEIYQAVNLISDDEEDDPEVEKLEEEVIMSTEADLGHDSLFASISSDILGNLSGTIFGTPDRMLGRSPGIPLDFDVRRPESGAGPDARKYSTGSTKRVRFWDEQTADEDSSSTSSELEAIFPDIFAEQGELPPLLQQLIENDTDGDLGNPSGSDGEHSYWDFSENDQSSPSQQPIDEDNGHDAEATSSGYDSDEGETTDEECPPPATIRSAKTLLHRSSSSDSDRAVNVKRPFRRSGVKSSRNRGPRWGHFSVDPSKATAFTDKTGRRVIVHPPQIPNAHSRFFPGSSGSSTANNSPRTSLIATPGEESDFGELTPQNVTNPRDIMFGGLFGMPQDVGNLLKGQVIGPPEAFFPFVSLDDNGNRIDEMDEFTEYEDDLDDDIDLENFLALPEAMEEDIFETPSQIPAESDATAGHSDELESTPVSRSRSFGESMLEHFDRTPGVVSSFRSNQDNYRKIAGQHPNPDLRASNSQAVRYGKSAEAPITPMRKRTPASRRPSSQIESPLLRHANSHPRRSGPRMGTFN